MKSQRFLCDQMLGSLARWLRILGIDTYFPTDDITDEELLTIAQKEKRILITRDKELMIRAEKRNIPLLPINTTDLDKQIRLVRPFLEKMKYEILTRCLLCNTKLEVIEKKYVKQKVPSKIYDQHERYWYCPHCVKYYWQGSHYDDMKQRIQHLEKK